MAEANEDSGNPLEQLRGRFAPGVPSLILGGILFSLAVALWALDANPTPLHEAWFGALGAIFLNLGAIVFIFSR